MDGRARTTVVAMTLALVAAVVIQAFGLGVHLFIALLVANAAFGGFGIVRAAMRRRWKPCLVFVAWFLFPLIVGLYLLHLWNTLPDRRP